MGERSLRRLLIIGASSVTKVAARDPDKAGAWLAGMLARKPRMLIGGVGQQDGQDRLGADGAWRVLQSFGRGVTVKA